MNCPFYKSKRHGGILLRAFFILIVLLSAAISQGDPDLLNFQADETGQSAVSFSRFNPFVFSDITSGPIIYDGSLNIPLGSFLMKNMPAIAEPDSIRHLTFFDYSQGDYGLRDITIGEEAHLWSGGSLKFIGMGRSFQGLYNNLGPLNSARNNVLQNYLLQFDRELERSEFSVGFQYHTENGGLPVAPDEYHYRKGESFNLGANYKYLNDSYEIAGRSAIQLGRFDLNGSYNFDSFTTWNDLAATYFYRPGMQFNAGIGRKSLNFEP
ncbi:MAG: hypothetical protein H8D46_01735, partial [FCB group bacterium]|nr:hypothetical protein [FCB group bacterium]